VEDFLSLLNQPQKDAVINSEGPMMIVAGAGSGKTRVITYRIAHLLKLGVEPFQILALTFTNKAAKEMKERIATIVGNNDAKSLWMGTFHAVFARILRVEAGKLGFPENFTIYDTEDSKSLLKTILKEMNLDDKIYKPNVIYGRISAAKNNLISWRSYQQNQEAALHDKAANMPLIGKIFEAYSKRCFAASAMDFDDLLFNTNVLFRDHPETLHKYQQKFKYIMVDEYQDTNYSQYLIVKKLAAMYENICVVGDDAQSIYAFRGANIQNILNFKNDYPDLKTYLLEQNYRSTKTIVNAANSVISKNRDQMRKEVWTENPEGEKIEVMRAFSDNEEGQLVANSIFRTKMETAGSNNHFAILYRTNAQSRAMEEALRKMNIPYKIYGGLSFYQRKEVKDLISYFRLTINHNDEEALKRIINYPGRGIGQTTIDKLIITASEKGVSLWNILDQPRYYELNVNAGTIAKLEDFGTLIKSFSVIAGTQTAYDAGNHIAVHSGILKELYNDKTPEGVSRYENIQELLNGLKEFAENDVINNEISAETTISNARLLKDYLQDIALLTGDEKEDQNIDKVSLMTIHAAKGLEFKYVYIVGLEENLFPSQMSIFSREDLEEERRLFYVALTRAEKISTISYSTSRYRWGSLISCEPSRFIDEIDAEHLNFKFNHQQNFEEPAKGWFAPKGSSFQAKKTGGFESKPSAKSAQKTTVPSNLSVPRNLKKLSNEQQNTPTLSNIEQGDDTRHLKVGDLVEHQRFGKGTIEEIDGIGASRKAMVLFENAGSKQLILKFAKLKILN
jgi:DNA helicase II / ATP-dependent DNA helicase PcrA